MAKPLRNPVCQLCSKPIDGPRTGGHPRRWCSACQPEGRKRELVARRRRAGAVTVGAVIACRHCGVSCTKRHKRQFYCDACSTLSAKSALPAARRVQIEYQKARNKLRRAVLPSVTIHERMSAGIKNSLRDGKGGRSWERLVSYTVAELMRHLERQFLPGMTWANRGEWHIDHIVPLASFKFETPDDPEFKAAWALTNLRPLWALDNIKKNASRTLLV